MRDPVRIAVVGAGGRSTQTHCPSLASFDDVVIAGICDLDPERLNAAADEFGIEHRASNYRKMVEEVSPDGIYVIGQPHYMYDIWVWCLQQGLHLFIEKPLGLNWHQARMLTELAEKHGAITQVSHQRRASPLLRKMRAACVERGAITHAICEFYKSDMKARYDARDHMMDDSTHAIDTVRWMCGGEVVEIESRCKRVGVPDINWIGATLHFDNGSTGYVLNNWASGRRVLRVQMHAPGISCDAEVEQGARLFADGDYEGEWFDALEVAGTAERWAAFGDRDKNREFVDSVKTGKEVTSSPFRDCVKTMEVAEKILGQAILEGR